MVDRTPGGLLTDGDKPGLTATLRGERMIRRWTLPGHPVTFLWHEVAMALWKALWLPFYFIGEDNFTVSTGYLARTFGGGATAEAAIAYSIGIVGTVHVAIMMLAWFGIARPHRTLRLSLNALAVIAYCYMAGIALGLEAWTTAGPYVLLAMFAVYNLHRAVRNGRGYRI